jgi:hypothetical protein
MASDPSNSPQATPPNPPPAEPSHEERLFRSTAQELALLKEQLQGMPTPDELEDLRSRASRFDELKAELPEWRRQLEELHGQQVQQLQQQTQAQAEELEAARFTDAARDAYIRAGGIEGLFKDFHRLAGDRLSKGPGGEVLLDGQPFREGFEAAVSDPLTVMGSFARPRLGSGSGARGSRDGRAVPGQNLSLGMGRDALMRAAFLKN